LWKREVEMRMLEWGMVDPSATRKGSSHGKRLSGDRHGSDEDAAAVAVPAETSSQFWDGMVAFCQKVARGDVETRNATSVNLPEMLPVNPGAALRVVLNQEIRALHTDDGLVDITDTLSEYGVPSYLSPYRYNPENGTKGLKYVYRHARIPSDQLHPLVRFRFKRVDLNQYVRQGNPDSVAFRAIVAHGACLHAHCAQCSAKRVRWNGYGANGGSIKYRYWKKLVCEACGSVYEIKWARSVNEAMCKLDTWVNGGSYLDEYAVVQAELHEALHGSGGDGGLVARQFVAMLVTDETVQQDGKECWPVYVAAVDHVVPFLKNRSFERGENCQPKVYARIFFEKASGKAGKIWFHIPVFKYNAKEIASEIIASL
jgi:hypothetical protein